MKRMRNWTSQSTMEMKCIWSTNQSWSKTTIPVWQRLREIFSFRNRVMQVVHRRAATTLPMAGSHLWALRECRERRRCLIMISKALKDLLKKWKKNSQAKNQSQQASTTRQWNNKPTYKSGHRETSISSEKGRCSGLTGLLIRHGLFSNILILSVMRLGNRSTA